MMVLSLSGLAISHCPSSPTKESRVICYFYGRVGLDVHQLPTLRLLLLLEGAILALCLLLCYYYYYYDYFFSQSMTLKE